MAVVCLALLVGGCASLHYRETKAGVLKGKLIVQWIDHDKFLFLPDQDRPLSFVRHNGTAITPGHMYTDGGSIPRPLWVFRNYSPWGYAPAFIVHDWLFVMKHCKIPGYDLYTLEEAAWVMSEVMKTMMERDGVDRLTLYAMFEAVRSPVAAVLWDNGTCKEPPVEVFTRAPRFEFVIDYRE